MTEMAKDARKPNAAASYRLFSRPADTSLTAYKEWIRETYEALMAQAGLPVEEDVTEEEWVRAWENFWKGAARETGQK